jgi:Cu-Zn family superoxide dismutase
MTGSAEYPNVHGTVKFYQTNAGVVVCAEINGLPHKNAQCGSSVFGFHIHDGVSCTGTEMDPFSNAMAHLNPDECTHPHHAGDLPPLFENNGYAFSVFLTDRFRTDEIIGKTVIIHGNPDDFTTQPSGNSGAKIACGKITV